MIFRRLLLLTALGVMLSGCFMAPVALIGPATSGWSTASLIQSGVTTGTNYMIKQSTGKSLSEHAYTVINEQVLQQTYSAINEQILKQTYFPKSSKKFSKTSNFKSVNPFKN